MNHTQTQAVTDTRPEATYRGLFDRIPLPLYRTSAEGDWLAGNQAFLDLVEADSLEDLPHARELWANPELRAGMIDEIEESEENYSERPILIRTLKNNLIWIKPQTVIVREHGRVAYFEGAMIDVTAEQRAQQAQTELASILEITSDVVLAVTPAGALRYVNKAGRDLFDIGEANQQEQRSITTLLPASFLDQLRSLGSFMTEVEVATTSGPVALELTTQEHRTSTGRLDYYSAIGRDITASNLVSEYLEDAVRTKDRFIASVSHELRTPLTTVLGFALELRDIQTTASPTVRAELTEAVIEHALELSDLVEDLLVNALFDSGSVRTNPSSVDLMVQLEQSLVSVTSPSMTNPFIRGSAEAWADPLRVRQIVRNLLTNAGRYGGPEVYADVREDGEWAILDISDDGPGLAESEWESIFDPYKSAHPDQSLSVGLGLTVSRRLARLMGGDLIYLREKGRSVFRLTLPRVATTQG